MLVVIVVSKLVISTVQMALSKIQGNEDTEWKFAKTELILTYFNAHDSLPAPFNLIPSPKIFHKQTPDELNRGTEVDEEYLTTINKLVMRYRKAQKVRKRLQSPTPKTIGATRSHIKKVSLTLFS